MPRKSPQRQQRVSIRRSPRLSAFVVVFGLVGFFGTLILTSLYDVDPTLGFATLFAYFSLYGITGSIALGIVLWLILDIRSKKKATEAIMESDDKRGD